MFLNSITFTGSKPLSFPSPKLREKPVKGWSSDDMGWIQFRLVESARNKIRIAQSRVVDMANANSKEERAVIKKEIRTTLDSAIKSIDKVLSSSTMKFYY